MAHHFFKLQFKDFNSKMQKKKFKFKFYREKNTHVNYIN